MIIDRKEEKTLQLKRKREVSNLGKHLLLIISVLSTGQHLRVYKIGLNGVISRENGSKIGNSFILRY